MITFAYMGAVVTLTCMATGQFLPRPARGVNDPPCAECGQPRTSAHTCGGRATRDIWWPEPKHPAPDPQPAPPTGN